MSLGLIILCFIIIGVSYALWNLSFTQTNENVVTTGCFKVEFTDQNPINLEKSYPISDDEGKSLTPYEFTLTNTCDSESVYYINLETITNVEKKLSEEYLKANLKKGENEVFLNTLNSSYINLEKVIPEASNAYKLYQGKLKAKEVTTFSLNIWLDEETPPINEVTNAAYEGKITITTSYKAPKETDNMMVAMEVSTGYLGGADYLVYNETYGQNYKYDEIVEINFQSQINPYENAVEVVDFSVAEDESVLGYYVKNENDKYVLYIQADGKIKANPDASYYGVTVNLNDVSETNLKINGLENLDTSYVTNMSHMFYGLTNETLNINHFDTKNVTDMSFMFSSMPNLTALDVSHFDTSKVTTMHHMFYGLTALTTLDLNNFNTSNTTSMQYMFSNSSHLNSITYGNHFIHNENANVEGMYSNCPASKPTHASWNSVFSE